MGVEEYSEVESNLMKAIRKLVRINSGMYDGNAPWVGFTQTMAYCINILGNIRKELEPENKEVSEYSELLGLREWKAKAMPWIEDQYYGSINVLEGEENLHPDLRKEYEGYLKELTELLNG